MSAGYVPRLDDADRFPTDISLYHPSEERAVGLTLYSDGRIVGDRGEIRIEPDDVRAFHRFVKSVPYPTWWERTRINRVKIYVFILLGLFYFLVVAAVSALLDWAKHL